MSEENSGKKKTTYIFFSNLNKVGRLSFIKLYSFPGLREEDPTRSGEIHSSSVLLTCTTPFSDVTHSLVQV